MVLLYTVSQLLRGVRVCFLLCARVKLFGRRRQKEGANETKPHPALLYAARSFLDGVCWQPCVLEMKARSRGATEASPEESICVKRTQYCPKMKK